MKYKILILFILSTLFSFGQRKEKWRQNSFFNDPIDKGQYFAISIGYTTIDLLETGMVGVSFMSINNHWFSYGITGKGHFSRPISMGNDYLNNMGVYCGFQLQPILAPKSIIHFSFPTSIGGGWLAQYLIIDNSAKFTFNEIYYAYVDPGIELEFNVTERTRITIGVHYMFRYNISELSNYNPKLNNLSLSLSFKFGNY